MATSATQGANRRDRGSVFELDAIEKGQTTNRRTEAEERALRRCCRVRVTARCK